MLTTERANEITIEEQLALPHSADTAEEAEFREQVKLDLAKIKEAGHETQIPNE